MMTLTETPGVYSSSFLTLGLGGMVDGCGSASCEEIGVEFVFKDVSTDLCG